MSDSRCRIWGESEASPGLVHITPCAESLPARMRPDVQSVFSQILYSLFNLMHSDNNHCVIRRERVKLCTLELVLATQCVALDARRTQ